MSERVRGHVTRLQVGEALPFAREQTSAINKARVEAVEVTTLGFVGDEQADQFFHGGQIQAVHQMPLRAYALIAEAFPQVTCHEGMLGENLIVSGMQEDNVCIGDVFEIGGVRLQITRPRRPCWKIDAQLDQRGVASFLQDQGCVGWYYRVLQTGAMREGDSCLLVSRDWPFASLARLWTLCNNDRLRDADEIRQWLDIPVLEQSFKQVLAKRLR